MCKSEKDILLKGHNPKNFDKYLKALKEQIVKVDKHLLEAEKIVANDEGAAKLKAKITEFKPLGHKITTHILQPSPLIRLAQTSLTTET